MVFTNITPDGRTISLTLDRDRGLRLLDEVYDLCPDFLGSDSQVERQRKIFNWIRSTAVYRGWATPVHLDSPPDFANMNIKTVIPLSEDTP